jgi:hypothetical protein
MESTDLCHQEVITGKSWDRREGGYRTLISLFGKSFGMLQKCTLEGFLKKS